MTTVKPTDFSLITETMLDDETYVAMLRVYRDRTCPGLCPHKEGDLHAIGTLQDLRNTCGVNFLQTPRGGDWIELNALAHAYIYWRQNMERGK